MHAHRFWWVWSLRFRRSLLGIGYFTLPLLVHTGVKCVHSCDWNEVALEGLRRGLIANDINNERCVIHYGDNRKVRQLIPF